MAPLVVSIFRWHHCNVINQLFETLVVETIIDNEQAGLRTSQLAYRLDF